MTAKTLPLASGKTTWKILAKYATKSKGLLLFVTLCFVLASLTTLVTPIMIGAIVDKAASGELTGLPWAEFALIIAAVLARAIFTMCWSYYGQKVGTQVNRDLGIAVMEASLSLNAQTIEDAGSGDLVTRVTSDLNAVQENVTSYLPSVVYNGVYLVVTFFTVLFLSPVMALVLVPIYITLPILLWIVLPRISRLVVIAAAEVSKFSTQITENVRGLATIQELGIVDQREAVLAAQNERIYKVQQHAVRLRTTLWAVIVLATGVPLVLALVWGALMVAQGLTTWGVVATVAIILFNLRWSLDEFSWCLDKLREATALLGRVCGVVVLAQTQQKEREKRQQEFAESAFAEPAGEQHRVAGRTGVASEHRTANGHCAVGSDVSRETKIAAVQLRNVNYGYDVQRQVIKDANLSLGQGKTLALVGRSGSGKTTLARLIAGSLTADSGSVQVLAKEVGAGVFPTAPAADGRPQLLICTQEAHQFVGSVADNLTVVKPAATAAEMLAALETVGAHWVQELPAGLHTQLGTETVQLTRDQVQQLSLARIVLADPHTVILDESTTQLELLDATESVQGIMHGRAVIVISHDARIASLADSAVLLEDGKLVATGSPAEIFARA